MIENRSNSLPEYYDQNMIGLFPQGPSVLYGYWELSLSQWKFAAGQGRMVIRLYKVRETDQADYEQLLVMEVEPPPFAADWYFRDLEPDSAYHLEIGCRLSSGIFFPLIKSDLSSTPPLPKVDPMPKPEVKHEQPDSPRPEFRFAGVNGDLPETTLKVDEVFESMPFYMGYHLNQ